MSDLKKVVLVKDYAVRHDIIIETGACVHVGEYRALQLKKNGFIKEDIDSKKAKKSLKDARIKREETPQTVIHKIEE